MTDKNSIKKKKSLSSDDINHYRAKDSEFINLARRISELAKQPANSFTALTTRDILKEGFKKAMENWPKPGQGWTNPVTSKTQAETRTKTFKEQPSLGSSSRQGSTTKESIETSCEDKGAPKSKQASHEKENHSRKESTNKEKRKKLSDAESSQKEINPKRESVRATKTSNQSNTLKMKMFPAGAKCKESCQEKEKTAHKRVKREPNELHTTKNFDAEGSQQEGKTRKLSVKPTENSKEPKVLKISAPSPGTRSEETSQTKEVSVSIDKKSEEVAKKKEQKFSITTPPNDAQQQTTSSNVSAGSMDASKLDKPTPAVQSLSTVPKESNTIKQNIENENREITQSSESYGTQNKSNTKIASTASTNIEKKEKTLPTCTSKKPSSVNLMHSATQKCEESSKGLSQQTFESVPFIISEDKVTIESEEAKSDSDLDLPLSAFLKQTKLKKRIFQQSDNSIGKKQGSSLSDVSKAKSPIFASPKVYPSDQINLSPQSVHPSSFSSIKIGGRQDDNELKEDSCNSERSPSPTKQFLTKPKFQISYDRLAGKSGTQTDRLESHKILHMGSCATSHASESFITNSDQKLGGSSKRGCTRNLGRPSTPPAMHSSDLLSPRMSRNSSIHQYSNEKINLLRRLATFVREDQFINDDDHLMFIRTVKHTASIELPEPIIDSIKVEVFHILMVSDKLVTEYSKG